MKSKKPKKAMGRPSTYNDAFPELLYNHLAEGLSFESFGGLPEVKACKKTLYNWLSEHPEFLHAKDKGEMARMIFLERLGRSGMAGKIKNFNLGAWVFWMKNMCGWRDRHEISAQAKIETNSTVTINYNDMTEGELLRAAKEKIIEIEGGK